MGLGCRRAKPGYAMKQPSPFFIGIVGALAFLVACNVLGLTNIQLSVRNCEPCVACEDAAE